MGVTGLIATIKKYAPAALLELRPVEGSAVGIDLSIYVYGWVACARGATDGGMNQIRRGILRQVEFCHHAGIRPVYVVDGAPGPAKEATLVERRAAINRIRIGRKIWDETLEFITLAGASYIQAPGESDTTLAAMCRDGWIIGVVTADADILALGSTMLTIPAKSGSGWSAISAEIAQHSLALTPDQWRIFCIAHGTDYNKRIVTPGRMLKIIGVRRMIDIEMDKLAKETEKGRAAMFGLLDSMPRIENLPPAHSPDIVRLRSFHLGETAEFRIHHLAGIRDGGDFDTST